MRGPAINTGETRFIRPIVGIYGKRGTAWFDDFQLREGLPTERVNLIRNSSFRIVGPGEIVTLTNVALNALPGLFFEDNGL